MQQTQQGVPPDLEGGSEDISSTPKRPTGLTLNSDEAVCLIGEGVKPRRPRFDSPMHPRSRIGELRSDRRSSFRRNRRFGRSRSNDSIRLRQAQFRTSIRVQTQRYRESILEGSSSDQDELPSVRRSLEPIYPTHGHRQLGQDWNGIFRGLRSRNRSSSSSAGMTRFGRFDGKALRQGAKKLCKIDEVLFQQEQRTPDEEKSDDHLDVAVARSSPSPSSSPRPSPPPPTPRTMSPLSPSPEPASSETPSCSMRSTTVTMRSETEGSVEEGCSGFSDSCIRVARRFYRRFTCPLVDNIALGCRVFRDYLIRRRRR